MTLEEIAKCNKESMEAFFGRCWKWRTGYRFPPTAQIREDLRIWNTEAKLPPYVKDYFDMFNEPQGHA